MDSLTTTGDGEAKTMTSDSGEQKRQVPFRGLCSQWWLWKPTFYSTFRWQTSRTGGFGLTGRQVQRAGRMAQIALCHWQCGGDGRWPVSGLWVLGVRKCWWRSLWTCQWALLTEKGLTSEWKVPNCARSTKMQSEDSGQRAQYKPMLSPRCWGILQFPVPRAGSANSLWGPAHPEASQDVLSIRHQPASPTVGVAAGLTPRLGSRLLALSSDSPGLFSALRASEGLYLASPLGNLPRIRVLWPDSYG